MMQLARYGDGQCVIDEGGLARPGNAGHADQAARRDAQIHVLQVVAAGARQDQPGQLAVDGAAFRDRDGARAA
ncbi:hypothetical protein D9M68_801040 [compost metagenome]